MKAYKIIFISCFLLVSDKVLSQRVRVTSSLGASAYLGDLVQVHRLLKKFHLISVSVLHMICNNKSEQD